MEAGGLAALLHGGLAAIYELAHNAVGCLRSDFHATWAHASPHAVGPTLRTSPALALALALAFAVAYTMAVADAIKLSEHASRRRARRRRRRAAKASARRKTARCERIDALAREVGRLSAIKHCFGRNPIHRDAVRRGLGKIALMRLEIAYLISFATGAWPREPGMPGRAHRRRARAHAHAARSPERRACATRVFRHESGVYQHHRPLLVRLGAASSVSSPC